MYVRRDIVLKMKEVLDQSDSSGRNGFEAVHHHHKNFSKSVSK
jgi:hypothetical protein